MAISAATEGSMRADALLKILSERLRAMRFVRADPLAHTDARHAYEASLWLAREVLGDEYSYWFSRRWGGRILSPRRSRMV